MVKSLATGLVGLGVTVASTFAPSLGLSLTQQRIGFVFGIALIALGAILFYLDREWSNLGDQLKLLIQDGIRLVAELSAPPQPEVSNGIWSLEFGEAPQEWWDKAEDFFNRSKRLLDGQHPALLPNFEDGFNGHLRRERNAQGAKGDSAIDDQPSSSAERMLAFASATERGPRQVVEATLDGLAAARRQWGAEGR
jgi:hypothetical protein